MGDLTRRTEHTADHLRWVVTGPVGDIEFRLAPNFAAVIHNNGDCELIQGDLVRLLWSASGEDDRIIWAELERYYATYHLNPEDQCRIAQGPMWDAARAAAHWADLMELHGTPGQREDARAAHQRALHRIILARREGKQP